MRFSSVFIIGTLLLSEAVRCPAAGTFIQGCQDVKLGGTTSTCVMPGTPSSGHLLAGVSLYIGTPHITLTSVSDGGSIFTIKTRVDPALDASMQVFYTCSAASTGATLTLTFSGTINVVYYAVADYSGNALSGCENGYNTGTGIGTALLSSSVSTTNATDLLLGLAVHGGDVTAAGDDGNGHSMTLRGALFPARIEDVNVTASGTYTASATGGSIDSWGIAILAVKAPASSSSRLTLMGIPFFIWPDIQLRFPFWR